MERKGKLITLKIPVVLDYPPGDEDSVHVRELVQRSELPEPRSEVV